MPGRLRVGIDLVDVETVRASIEEFGEAYLHRFYTAREIEDCRGEAGIDPTRLAARFAAKEATVKVLRADVDINSWRTIEVIRAPGGWCDIELTGSAAQLASDAGLTDMSLSLTHEGQLAAAVVVANCEAR